MLKLTKGYILKKVGYTNKKLLKSKLYDLNATKYNSIIGTLMNICKDHPYIQQWRGKR